MKKMIPVLLVLVFLAAGTVSAAVGGDIGYYDITSTPAGAEITLDGSAAGITPANASLYSTGTPGHTILIRKSGYEPWSRYYEGNPAAGAHIAVHADLVPIPETPHAEMGFYRVNSDPAGGTVTLDGKDYGLTPVTISVSSAGTPGHTITISRSGYQTWSRSFTANPGPDQRIEVFATLVPVNQQYGSTETLHAEMGFYRVNSDPSGGTVKIDGIDYGLTPVTVSVSSNGTPGHTITISRSGYQTWSRVYDGNPGPDQRIDVFATLIPSGAADGIPVKSSPAATAAVPPVPLTPRAPLSLIPMVTALSVAGFLAALPGKRE